MWKRLENYYEDGGASVQAALEDLHKLKAVSEDDYKGLVKLIDEIESAYSQLEELNQLNILTMRDVDMISERLPSNLKVEWRRKYRHMDPSTKVNPFVASMNTWTVSAKPWLVWQRFKLNERTMNITGASEGDKCFMQANVAEQNITNVLIHPINRTLSITRRHNAKSSSNFQSVGRTENIEDHGEPSRFTPVLNASEITEGKIVQRKSRARVEVINIISFFVNAKILKKRLRKRKRTKRQLGKKPMCHKVIPHHSIPFTKWLSVVAISLYMVFCDPTQRISLTGQLRGYEQRNWEKRLRRYNDGERREDTPYPTV